MKSVKRTALVLCFVVIILRHCDTKSITATTTANGEFVQFPNHNIFASDIFSVIVEGKSFENVVYSPASIQTCLALAYMGAEEDTAEEMHQVLSLGTGDKILVAKKFHELLMTGHSVNNSNMPILKMINRLYVSDQLNVSEEFSKIAIEYFNARTEKVNFNDYKHVVKTINEFVAQQTECKIENILNDHDISNSNTNLVLINSIYLQGNWLRPFSQSSTTRAKFHLNLNATQEVDFMYNEEFYGYADLKELSATALEMPFNNSDLSMLIILPNAVEGLKNLELQLKNKNLNEIVERMVLQKVHVHVPKFRLEFDIDLKEALKKLGLSKTFSSNANFNSLFTSTEYQSIMNVKHKAYLDVNEAGLEAAASTFATLTTLSGFFDEPVFQADHPFVFAIRSATAVYFAGHVAAI